MIDVGEREGEDGVGGGAGGADLGDVLGPGADLGGGHAGGAVGQKGDDAAVVQGGEPPGGQGGQGRDGGGDGGQQEGVGQALVGAVGAQPARVGRGEVLLGEFVIGQEEGLEPVPPELGGGAEQARALGVEDGVLVALDDVGVGVSHGDEVGDGHGLAPVDEHLLHDLQGGAVALHDAGEVAQGVHEGGREGVGEAELGLGGALVGLVGVDAVQEDVPDAGGAVDGGEGRLDRLPGGLVLGLEEAPGGHVGEVVVPQGDGGEAAGLVAEGVIEGLAVGAGLARGGVPALEVHLAGDEGDERDGQAPVAAFDELGDLLGLAAEGALVLHLEGEPEDELVQEEDDGVVAQPLGVGADGGQPLVQADEVPEAGVGGEGAAVAGQGGDEVAPLLRPGGGGAGGVVALDAPAVLAQEGGEGILASASGAEQPDEVLIADGRAHGLGVGQELVGLVDGGQGRVGVEGADLAHVALEDDLLHGAAAQEVEGQGQEALVLEAGVVGGDGALELTDGAGVRIVAQDGVQDGHEVGFSGAEGARQEGAAVLAGGHGVSDEGERGAEGGGDLGGDHVLADGFAGAVAGGGVGQAQDVVLGAGGLGDGEDVLEEGGAHAFFFLPRRVGAGRQARTSASVRPRRVRRSW